MCLSTTRRWHEQREQGAASWKGADGGDNPAIWHSILERTTGNEFLGYGAEAGDGEAHGDRRERRRAARTARRRDGRRSCSSETPFYAESGGQAGDRGVIKFANGAEFVVEDTLEAGRRAACACRAPDEGRDQGWRQGGA